MSDVALHGVKGNEQDRDINCGSLKSKLREITK
jgi:hypothetical protein